MSTTYTAVPLSPVILERVQHGEKLTDNELLGAARHFLVLDELLTRMGAEWRMAATAAMREGMRLVDMVKARDLLSVLEAMLVGTPAEMVTLATLDDLVFQGSHVADKAGDQACIDKARAMAEALIKLRHGKARRADVQRQWLADPDLKDFIVC